MNQREKILADAVGILATVLLLYFVISRVSNSCSRRSERIATLENEIFKKNNKILRGAKDEKKLKNIEKECAALFPIFELVQEEGRLSDKDKEGELFDGLLAVNKEIWNLIGELGGCKSRMERGEGED